MAMSNESDPEPVLALFKRVTEYLEPILTPLKRAVRYVGSSFFRFLILFGLLLLVFAAIAAEGIVAGHLGIYGATAVLVGVLGRLVVHWKLRGST